MRRTPDAGPDVVFVADSARSGAPDGVVAASSLDDFVSLLLLPSLLLFGLLLRFPARLEDEAEDAEDDEAGSRQDVSSASLLL